MNDEVKANLAASLSTAVTELGEVARDLPGITTGKEIEQYAEILEQIGDSARGGAAILRAALDARRQSYAPLPQRMNGATDRPPDSPRSKWRCVVTEDGDVTADLELLRREWGHAYLIWFQTSVYCACRRDNGAICRRTVAEELRQEMDADYRACPVRVP